MRTRTSCAVLRKRGAGRAALGSCLACEQPCLCAHMGPASPAPQSPRTWQELARARVQSLPLPDTALVLLQLRPPACARLTARCVQGAQLCGSAAQRLVGAGPAGAPRPPQRGCHGAQPAGRQARAVPGQPAARPGADRLPGQVHPEDAQGAAAHAHLWSSFRFPCLAGQGCMPGAAVCRLPWIWGAGLGLPRPVCRVHGHFHNQPQAPRTAASWGPAGWRPCSAYMADTQERGPQQAHAVCVPMRAHLKLHLLLQTSSRGRSAMQPRQADGAASAAAVRSAAFAALAEQDVPVDSLFLHRRALNSQTCSGARAPAARAVAARQGCVGRTTLSAHAQALAGSTLHHSSPPAAGPQAVNSDDVTLTVTAGQVLQQGQERAGGAVQPQAQAGAGRGRPRL